MPVLCRCASARLVVLCASLTACGGGGGPGATAVGGTAPSSRLAATVDSIAESRLKTGNIAGVSIGVMRGRDTIVMKGYGKADLELDVPTPAHAVYEVGSVTKQFTSAAILQLRDAGKLSLDDTMTRYFPGYPTQGNTITVRQLLNHTSGIKGYTEMPAAAELFVRDLPRDSLVALFKKERFDFPTGTAMVYNNSAYFLAGLLVEKLAGMSYSEYLKQNIFDKLGMRDARYCSEKQVQKGKVKGYDVGPGPARSGTATGDTAKPPMVLVNKGYMVHTWPYSAGSLCMSINDLVAWNRALHAGGFLSAASYQDLTSPAKLNDGTALHYGLGLALRTVGGHRLIEHGGGIPGFTSASHYYPDDSLTVVVLTNTAGPVAPDGIATDVAMAILGRKDEPEVAFPGDLAALAGTYSGIGRGRALDLVVALKDKGLTAAISGAEGTEPLRFVGNDTWVAKEERLQFVPSKGGMQLRLDQTYGFSTLTRK